MFKKAKRANLRRRNESDEDEKEENRQPQLAPTLFGPVVDEIPFIETASNSVTGASGTPNIYHSNGLLANTIRAAKKGKDTGTVPGPTKASLLSFDDEDGNFINQC